MDYTSCQQPIPTVITQHPPLDDCRKNETFFETNRLIFVRNLSQLKSRFFCSVQLSNLISRNFHYDAMQQYRWSNFSDMFSLNCIFLIDAAVKHLISRSFFKCGVSAVSMAALKNCFKTLNQTFITTYSFRYSSCSTES